VFSGVKMVTKRDDARSSASDPAEGATVLHRSHNWTNGKGGEGKRRGQDERNGNGREENWKEIGRVKQGKGKDVKGRSGG